MLTDSKLKSQIDALWNRFWSGGITNPLTASAQIINVEKPKGNCFSFCRNNTLTNAG